MKQDEFVRQEKKQRRHVGNHIDYLGNCRRGQETVPDHPYETEYQQTARAGTDKPVVKPQYGADAGRPKRNPVGRHMQFFKLPQVFFPVGVHRNDDNQYQNDRLEQFGRQPALHRGASIRKNSRRQSGKNDRAPGNAHRARIIQGSHGSTHGRGHAVGADNIRDGQTGIQHEKSRHLHQAAAAHNTVDKTGHKGKYAKQVEFHDRDASGAVL